MKRLMIAAGLCLAAGSATAEPLLTGEEILKRCVTPKNQIFPHEECGIWIDGVIQGMAYGVAVANGGTTEADYRENRESWVALGFCVPEGVGFEQRALIFIEFLSRNPEKLHREASGLMQEAFQQVFPCG